MIADTFSGEVLVYDAADGALIVAVGNDGQFARLCGVLGLTLRQPAVEYLGKISFGLYVFHVAALRIAGSAVAGLALTVLAAALSYRFLESPFLRWKGRLARVESRPI